MRHGVEFGRRGYGAIYVVASGNGGVVGDNCNYDGYANTVYTVTVGAVGEDGAMPYYGEECASMLAVTFSSSAYHRSIVSGRQVFIDYDFTCSLSSVSCLQCFDAVGWASGRASGL